MPYPNGSDLAQFLLEAGVISAIPDPLPDSYELFVGAAITAFEMDSGWQPFLANDGGSGGNETRTFDLESCRLYLPAGLISLEGLSMRGTELVENENFWLEDHRAAPPYTWIEFAAVRPGRRIVEITGVWGYTTTLPDDVRLAILSFAAANLATSLSGPGGELTKVKQDDVQYDFAAASGSGLGQIASWQKDYKSVVSRYRRVTLV